MDKPALNSIAQCARSVKACVAGLLLACAVFSPAADQVNLHLQTRFAGEVLPFLNTYCTGCHDSLKNKGKLDLTCYATVPAIVPDHRLWKTVIQKLADGEMPPEEEDKQPTAEERQAVVDWIRALHQHEAASHAGDPGVVLARRLSNAEYDLTLRDLTGVDIRPAREFPVDPANESGFDNTGESLGMSAILLKKYLDAARLVSDHLVLLPDGFLFAPHSALTESDRDKFCVRRIVDFYDRHRIDYADYFYATWQHRHRALTGHPARTLTGTAQASGLSPKYLAILWDFLMTGPGPDTPIPAGSPLASLQGMWEALPVPEKGGIDGHNVNASARTACERMRDFIVDVRRQLEPEVGALKVNGIAAGSQPLLLWKNRQYAANRMRYSGGRIVVEGESFGGNGEAMEEAALQRFCRVFPDAFFIAERGRMYLDPKQRNSGRLLSAGFHLMMGYFRDDRPLYELVLDEAQQSELDQLWQDLNFVTSAPMRQYKDFVFFERAEPPRFMQGAEFDFARSEDKEVVSPALIGRLAEGYLGKARAKGANEEAIEAIDYFFRNIGAEIRRVEASRAAAQPSQLKALLTFTERAYRRPLTEQEKNGTLLFYRSLREKSLGHEEAIRDAVASVLFSPQFSYRINVASSDRDHEETDLLNPRGDVRPLSDYSLASRLSYFLWSSMPDTQLLSRAASGELHRPEILAAEARRMMQDPRVRGLATEFAGNWLGFRRFEEHNAVDRKKFITFNDELRAAMFEEPIRFFVDLAAHNGSVLEFVFGHHTWVNPILARHYGISGPAFETMAPHEWMRIDDAARFGRGGMLPMSVFLTLNAPGPRTSPVKRGYWVVRRLLGEHIPAPPPDVPELPNDESKTGELTLPQLLARHRDNKSCAGCHDRFDSIGLALEGFGPVGELRLTDLAGRPVESLAVFPDGAGQGVGLDGLRDYLQERRRLDFIDNLCRKMLSYALGRGLLLSDEPLIEDMRMRLAANEYRLGILVDSIVTSPQFLSMREAL